MSAANDQKFRSYTIGLLADQEYTLDMDGDMFAVTNAESPFMITFDESNRLLNVSTGFGARFDSRYRRIVFLSETNQTLVIILGTGDFRDARASGVAGATFNVTVENGNSSPVTEDVSLPAGATTQILAPNAARKSATIFAGEFNIENLRIGCTASVSATNGGILAPGGNGTLETQTGIWVYNPGAEVESVLIIELESL